MNISTYKCTYDVFNIIIITIRENIYLLCYQYEFNSISYKNYNLLCDTTYQFSFSTESECLAKLEVSAS